MWVNLDRQWQKLDFEVGSIPIMNIPWNWSFVQLERRAIRMRQWSQLHMRVTP